MATTREKLIDWLADLPDNAEIGIEDIYLMAMVGSRAQSFMVGDLSDESINIDLQTVIIRRGEMKERMREIHEAGAGNKAPTEGVMVVTFEGYVRGVPELFTNDMTEAFRFKDKKHAEDFITEFADELLNPQVLRPSVGSGSFSLAVLLVTASPEYS
jgi:hypothetical protein